MKLVIWLTLLALAASPGKSIAYCPPEVDYSVLGEFERADYVGVVRVTGATWLDEQGRPSRPNLRHAMTPAPFDSFAGVDYLAKPVRTFKGRPSTASVIFSENTEARTPLVVGARYLVFLKRQATPDEFRRVGDIMIDYCGNSSLLGRAGPALYVVQHRAEYRRLERFLVDYVRNETDLAYTAAFADLNGDGVREVVVRLSGQGWCGSGGCTLLVLSKSNYGFTLVSRITITQAPIRLLRTRHHGWRDLGVNVRGAGITHGYEAALAFDGKQYPSNPSVEPARRLAGARGRVLIRENDPVRTVRHLTSH